METDVFIPRLVILHRTPQKAELGQQKTKSGCCMHVCAAEYALRNLRRTRQAYQIAYPLRYVMNNEPRTFHFHFRDADAHVAFFLVKIV
jgi:hypothetical protein